MDEYFARFFETADFPARWHCGNWAEFHGWLHVCSDVAIFFAYMAIPCVLAFFIRRRADLPFPRVLWMFVAFICSCGIGHMIEATIFWVPIYRVAGLSKFITATVSWATVGVLIYAMPAAIRLRSPEALAREVAERTAELRAAEAFQRSILETSPAGMLIVSASGRIEYANLSALELFGIAETASRGLDAERLISGGVLRLPSSVPADEGRVTRTIVRDDGSERFVEIRINPLDLPSGPGLVASVVDLSERRRAERKLEANVEQLARANRDLDEFAYVASHDLRGPLEGVKSLARWIAEDNRDSLEPQSHEHLEMMQGRVERLERLLDDLLQYSRAGRVPVQVETVEVRECLREVEALLALPGSVTLEVPDALPRLETVRTPLMQVFQNLIGNAVKHHDREAQTVTVGWVENEDHHMFSISDDGPGVPPEYQEQVFGMFETLRPRDQVEGSGMGLAIIKKIVERHGGRVWLEDARPRGARFCFTWPKRMKDDDA